MSPKLFKVSKNVKGMSKDMQKASRRATNMANKFSSGVNKMVGKAAKAGAAFATLAGAAVIKVGFDGLDELDEGATKVKSIAKGALELKKIKTDLLKTSNKTGIGVGELSDTQYNAISSGVGAKDSIGAAVTASKLAKAGFTDSNSALKILTSTMNVYGMAGQKAMSKISDKMLITQNLGVTTVAELAESMGPLTPIANSAGLSIDELMANMASLTKNGLKTEEAVTNLKGIMTSVIKPTAEAQKMAKKLGLDFSVDAIKSKGFAKFLAEVKEKTGGSTEKMGKLFGNVRALSGALVLTGKGFEDFNTSLGAMKNSAGATDEAFKLMENTRGSKLRKLKNIAKNTATSIMNSQSGAIGKMVDDLKTWVDENQDNIQKWAENIGNSLAKIVRFVKNVFGFIKKHQNIIVFVLTFTVALAGLMKAFKAVQVVIQLAQVAFALFNGTIAISPIGWAIGIIAGLIAIGVLLWKNWDKVKEVAGSLWDKTKEVFGGIKESITGAFDSAKEKVGAFFNWIGEKLCTLDEKIESIPVIGQIYKGAKYVGGGIANLVTGKNALGTSYWRGGVSLVGEHGPELVNMPRGSKVHTASQTKNIVNSKKDSITINIYANGVTSDQVINEVVPKLKLALTNI